MGEVRERICLSEYYQVFNVLLQFFINLDMQVQGYMLAINSPWPVKIMLLITYLGSPWAFIILCTVASTYLQHRRKTLEAIFLNIALFSSWGTMEWLKMFIERNRPLGEALTVASGYSFPSGHAMLSLVFYGFLANLMLSSARRRKRFWWGAIGLYLLILIIGFSRMYLNVHYTSDVLAGYLFGMVLLVASIEAMKWFKKKRMGY